MLASDEESSENENRRKSLAENRRIRSYRKLACEEENENENENIEQTKQWNWRRRNRRLMSNGEMKMKNEAKESSNENICKAKLEETYQRKMSKNNQ